jgi:hypothetical protein
MTIAALPIIAIAAPWANLLAAAVFTHLKSDFALCGGIALFVYPPER